MTGVQCDMCRKMIKDADRGRTYFTIGELDLCPACVDKFEDKVKSTVKRNPYTFENYKKAYLAAAAKIGK